MLNIEKFLAKIVDLNNNGYFAVTKNNEIYKCDGEESCDRCVLHNYDDDCIEARHKWLFSEYKKPVEPVELTEEEYWFCKLLGDRYLAKSDLGHLQIFYKKPTTVSDVWIGTFVNYSIYLDIFENLSEESFPFIKSGDEEPYSAIELLKNCVVKSKKSEE